MIRLWVPLKLINPWTETHPSPSSWSVCGEVYISEAKSTAAFLINLTDSRVGEQKHLLPFILDVFAQNISWPTKLEFDRWILYHDYQPRSDTWELSVSLTRTHPSLRPFANGAAWLRTMKEWLHSVGARRRVFESSCVPVAHIQQKITELVVLSLVKEWMVCASRGLYALSMKYFWLWLSSLSLLFSIFLKATA